LPALRAHSSHSRALRACLCQARRVGAVALVAGPACAFNRTIDYFSGAPPLPLHATAPSFPAPFRRSFPPFPLISSPPCAHRSAQLLRTCPSRWRPPRARARWAALCSGRGTRAKCRSW
jgi:hypothetical protein